MKRLLHNSTGRMPGGGTPSRHATTPHASITPDSRPLPYRRCVPSGRRHGRPVGREETRMPHAPSRLRPIHATALALAIVAALLLAACSDTLTRAPMPDEGQLERLAVNAAHSLT